MIAFEISQVEKTRQISAHLRFDQFYWYAFYRWSNWLNRREKAAFERRILGTDELEEIQS